MLALARAVLDLSPDAPGVPEPPVGDEGDDGAVNVSAQPFTYTVILGPGEIRTGIDFGVRRLIVGPVAVGRDSFTVLLFLEFLMFVIRLLAHVLAFARRKLSRLD